MNGKFCAICVYNNVCPNSRKHATDVVDCCIPEAPLRELQRKARTTEDFIAVTRDYVNKLKEASAYWSTQQ